LKQVGGFTLPLPPIPEQRRIVDILNRANGIRRLRREALDKARQLIPALFVEMFGDPVKNPKEWSLHLIRDLVGGFEGGRNLQAGPEKEEGERYRILKISAVTSGYYLPQESKPAPTSYEPPINHLVRPGDLLFSRANTVELVGATAFVNETPPRMLLPDKIWRVLWRSPSPVVPEFLLALFQNGSIRRAMGQIATGTSDSMRNISKGRSR
jgi:type I restriction enzyme, S subunit